MATEIDMGRTTFGQVTIDCPGCGREATFPIHAAGPVVGVAGQSTTVLTLDMDAVAAHMLTHGQHDGEPLPIAA